MRFKIAVISIISGIISFTSCNDNEPYHVTYPTMGTVSDLTSYTILSDSYGALIPTNPGIISAKEADSIGQRVLININFPKEEDKKKIAANEVDIYELFKVLTKDANDLRKDNSENKDNFGDSPIQIIPNETSAYISQEHLNIEFYINGQNTEIPHRISLLLTENSKLDDEGLLNVELKHNSYNDGNNEKFWGVVSFTLSSIPECSDPDFKGFRIIYRDTENKNSELKVFKRSPKNSLSNGMVSSEEICNRHTFFTGKLQ